MLKSVISVADRCGSSSIVSDGYISAILITHIAHMTLCPPILLMLS